MKSLVCVSDYETEAHRILPQNALDYYRSGAMQEITLRENKEAFNRWYIRPRFLRDVSWRSLSTTILGNKVSVPYGIAPTAMQRMAHPDGEIANARAAGKIGTVFTLSTIATTSIEKIAEHAPDTLRFFQLYIYKDRMANFQMDDEKSNLVNTSAGGSGINEYVKSLFDPSLTWDDVTWLTRITKLPIVLKGILTAEDAILGLKAGAAAIWVSNHGARQVDGVPPTIEVLQEVVKAVNGQCEVYIDGGFSQGTEIFKALALGAQMVFLGRPLLWGLACEGEEGANKVLDILYSELDSVMSLSGCSTVKDITRDMIIRKEYYARL